MYLSYLPGAFIGLLASDIVACVPPAILKEINHLKHLTSSPADVTVSHKIKLLHVEETQLLPKSTMLKP